MSYSKTTQHLLIIPLIIIVFSKTTLGYINSSQDNPFMLKSDKWLEDRKHPSPFGTSHIFNTLDCSLSPELVDEIFLLKKNVEKIVDLILKGEFRRLAYENLTVFTERTSGSEVLDKAISFLNEKMADLHLSNMHEEIIEIPIWSRGFEVAMVIDPLKMELHIRAFGMTVETPKKGLIAPILVVHSFRELEEQKDDVIGRIVIFNSKSGDDQKHILFGPSVAGKYGAIGVLCRSPMELVYAPAILYQDDAPKIPAAVISRDDADKLEEMSSRHDFITVVLRLTDQVHGRRNARNIFGDYVGSELKNDSVLLTSHIGSWDQGEGVQYDAVGTVLKMLTIQVLQSLQLKPKRSIRLAILSAEESGFAGTAKWVKKHRDELVNVTAAVEADLGCSKATGLTVAGTSDAACILKEIMNLFEDKTGVKLLSKMEGKSNSNVLPVHGSGVPMITLNRDDNNGGNFETQQTFLDSVTAVNPEELDRCLATFASTVYVLAELKERLPRKYRT